MSSKTQIQAKINTLPPLTERQMNKDHTSESTKLITPRGYLPPISGRN